MKVLDFSTIAYVAGLFIFVFGIFNGASREKQKIKASALKAFAIVAFALALVAIL